MMEKEARATLEILIKEQKERIPQLKKEVPPPNVIMPSYYVYEDNSHYIKWLKRTKRFLDTQFPSDKDVDNFERISEEKLCPEQQEELLAILEAFLEYPDIVEKEKPNSSNKNININNNISNTNTQSQQQSQQQTIEILVKALEDQLSVTQLKEIKQIVEEEKGDLEKAKPKLIDKIKSFGENVASNILANIITNPAIWSCLG
ncbi:MULTISPECIES: peptide chain release factor 1 [Prevotella]|uniref:Peptide chain release factor 1 n=1 Tax=Prevotella intermedia TaxID=28131 RepID=A0A2A6EDU6_PREIN|nr:MULTISPECIES: peptide chain release factor 1 [Prevotella]PDP59210.1 peptide chain release factor 1 [Prevotella intermedia]PDP82132.1 peptide chain release factor 1 [Prevotella intermedia]QUB52060.1 peptide chain release factor 1 [Prevotella nigrescens]